MVMNKNMRYFNGNTVLIPDFEPQKNEEYEKLRKERIAAKENIKAKNIKRKLNMIRNIVLCFAMGIFLVYRYSVIFSMQNSLNSMRNQISDLTKENQNLSVELAKYSSAAYIEDNAVNKLHMQKYNKSNAVYIDFSQKVIKEPVQVKSSENIKNGIIGKIQKILLSWGLKIG